MMKRFLGIVCLLYATLIIYVFYTKEINNYLAPNMQIYLKIVIIPLIIIGLVQLFNNKISYYFKVTDLILLLPIIMFIIAGNGILTASFASNRSVNKMKTRIKTKEIIEKNEEPEEALYDFSNPDFLIIDENYEQLSSYLSYEPKASIYEGKTIKLKGFAVKYASYIPDDYVIVGRYLISCCAADATFTGFFIKYNPNLIKNNKWYEIEGVLKRGKDKDGYDIMYVDVVNIKDTRIDNQYVYPCYGYGDNACEEVIKYNLEY